LEVVEVGGGWGRLGEVLPNLPNLPNLHNLLFVVPLG